MGQITTVIIVVREIIEIMTDHIMGTQTLITIISKRSYNNRKRDLKRNNNRNDNGNWNQIGETKVIARSTIFTGK